MKHSFLQIQELRQNQSQNLGCNIILLVVIELLLKLIVYYFSSLTNIIKVSYEHKIHTASRKPTRRPFVTNLEPTLGGIGGGTHITVSGENFCGRKTKIFVGKKSCLGPHLLSEKEFTCITPEGLDKEVHQIFVSQR